MEIAVFIKSYILLTVQDGVEWRDLFMFSHTIIETRLLANYSHLQLFYNV